MAQDRAKISEWMHLASSGSADAFGRIAAAMQDDLLRLALACGLAHADAAEVAQETLLRAYRQRRKWHIGSDAVAWLYGIAMNVIRELRRKRRRSRTVALDLTSLAASQAADGETGKLLLLDNLQPLAEAISTLPPRQWEAVSCRFLRGMSIRDTAAAMGCAEGTVKAAVAAALENLRKRLKARQ